MKYRKLVLKNIIVSLVILIIVFLIMTTMLYQKAVDKVYKKQQYIYNRQFLDYKIEQDDYEHQYNLEYENAQRSILEEENEAGYGSFRIDIAVQCDYNNSVGNEWAYSTKINDRTVSDGDIVYCPLDSNSSIYTECIEDDKVPDYANYICYYTIKNGLKINIKMVNVENRGRYSGNSAQHTFTYEFTRYIPDYKVVAAMAGKLPDEPIEPKEPNRADIKLSLFGVAQNKPIVLVVLAVIVVLRIFALKSEIEAENKAEEERAQRELERQRFLKEEERKRIEQEQLRIKIEQDRKKALEEHKRKEEEKKQAFLSKYGDKTQSELLDMVGAPKDVGLDDNGLPVKYVDGVNIYDVYISSSGTKYHAPYCRYAKNCRKYNLYYTKGYEPCSFCHPVTDGFSWYKKYLDIVNQLKIYNGYK